MSHSKQKADFFAHNFNSNGYIIMKISTDFELCKMEGTADAHVDINNVTNICHLLTFIFCS